MFYVFSAIVSAWLGAELILSLVPSPNGYLYSLCMSGFCIAYSLFNYFCFFLSIFFGFSNHIIYVVTCLFFVVAAFLSKRRKNILVNFTTIDLKTIFGIIMIFNLITVIISSHFFLDGYSISAADSKIPFELSISTSIAYGPNSKGVPFFYSCFHGAKISHYNISFINSAILLLGGSSIRTSIIFPRYVSLLLYVSSISFFASLYSQTILFSCVSISVFISMFYINNTSLDLLLLSGNSLFSVPLSIFGITFIFIGIFQNFDHLSFFFIAGICIGTTFLQSPDVFFGSIIQITIIAILYFPYFDLYKWRKVSAAWFTVVMIIIGFVSVFGFFSDFILNYSICFVKFEVKTILNQLKSIGLIGLILVHQIIRSFVKNSTNLFKLIFSFGISFFAMQLITNSNSSQDLPICLILIPFISVICSDFILSFLEKGILITQIISIVLLTYLIYPGIVHSAALTRQNRKIFLTPESENLFDWTVKNTPRNATFLIEDQSPGQFISLTGRSTFLGETNFLNYIREDIPQRKRELFFYMNNLDDQESMKYLGVNYIVKRVNSSLYSFQRLPTYPNWVHLITEGNWAIFKNI